MKKHIVIIAVLLLLTCLPATGCESPPPEPTPPPPITDTASFIENLEYAGASANITGLDKNAKPFASYYTDYYRMALNSIDSAMVDPAFLAESNEHLRQVDAQAAAMGLQSTLMFVKGKHVITNEYADAAAAEADAGYADYAEMEVTIPTSAGNLAIAAPGMRIGDAYCFKKGRIIVTFIDLFNRSQAEEDNSAAVLEILRSLLGPEFYALK